MEWRRISLNAAVFAKVSKEMELEEIEIDSELEKIDPGVRAVFKAPKIEKLFIHGSENPRGLMASSLIYPSDDYDYPAFAYDWGVMVVPRVYIFTLVDLHPLRKDEEYKKQYIEPIRQVYDKYSTLHSYKVERKVKWAEPFHSGYDYHGRIPPENVGDSLNMILEYFDVWLKFWREAKPQQDPRLKAEALTQKKEMRETYKKQYPGRGSYVRKYGSAEIADKLVNLVFS